MSKEYTEEFLRSLEGQLSNCQTFVPIRKRPVSPRSARPVLLPCRRSLCYSCSQQKARQRAVAIVERLGLPLVFDETFLFVTLFNGKDIQTDHKKIRKLFLPITKDFILATHYIGANIHYHLLLYNPITTDITKIPSLGSQVHNSRSVQTVNRTTDSLIAVISYILKYPIANYANEKQRRKNDKVFTKDFLDSYSEYGNIRTLYFGIFSSRSKGVK